MKLTFSAFIFLFATKLFAQNSDSVNNFYSKDSQICWQKIYSTKMTFEKLKASIIESGVLTTPSTDENKIVGDLRPIIPDFKGAGFSPMNVTIFVRDNRFIGFTVIEFRDNKYRVTVKKISLIEKYTNMVRTEGHVSNLETYAIKKTGIFKDSFKATASKILDYSFSNIFDFNKETKGDW